MIESINSGTIVSTAPGVAGSRLPAESQIHPCDRQSILRLSGQALCFYMITGMRSLSRSMLTTGSAMLRQKQPHATGHWAFARNRISDLGLVVVYRNRVIVKASTAIQFGFAVDAERTVTYSIRISSSPASTSDGVSKSVACRTTRMVWPA